MNRVWAAAGLLAAVAGLCAFCLWYVHLSTDNLTAELETITAALEREDRAVALQETESARKNWKQGHAVLCMFLSHVQLAEVDRSLAALPAYITLGEIADGVAECGRIAEMVRHLRESELPLVQNIL